MTRKRSRRRVGRDVEMGGQKASVDLARITPSREEVHAEATHGGRDAQIDALAARVTAIERQLRQRAGLTRLRGRRPVTARDVSVDALMPRARERP
jgi:hypothetical protein